MSGDIELTLTGNLIADPDLRFTPSGAAVAAFTVAQTPRVYDKAAGAWKDGETVFLRCSVWREQAENVAASLHKGDRVMVTGRLTQRGYETKEGEKRTVYEVQAEEVGASARYATLMVKRAERSEKHATPLQLAPTGTEPPF